MVKSKDIPDENQFSIKETLDELKLLEDLMKLMSRHKISNIKFKGIELSKTLFEYEEEKPQQTSKSQVPRTQEEEDEILFWSSN